MHQHQGQGEGGGAKKQLHLRIDRGALNTQMGERGLDRHFDRKRGFLLCEQRRRLERMLKALCSGEITLGQ